MATKKPKKTIKTLKWRARIIMAEKGIRSVTKLKELLSDECDVEISVAQLGRLIDGKSELLNKQVIEGLMAVFECELKDLLRTDL